MAYGTIMGQTPRGGGKRYATVVIGTSTAGWTTADCDFLCDGTNDQVEIQMAINQISTNGGEILLLNGTYNIQSSLNFNLVQLNQGTEIVISGTGDSTVLNFSSSSEITNSYARLTIRQVYLKSGKIQSSNTYSDVNLEDNKIENMTFSIYSLSFKNNRYINSIAQSTSVFSFTSGAAVIDTNNFLLQVGVDNFFSGGSKLSLTNNVFQGTTGSDNSISAQINSTISGNVFENMNIILNNCSFVGNTLKKSNVNGGFTSCVSGNYITDGFLKCGAGSTITGNIVTQSDTSLPYCISVYKTLPNESATKLNTITGNSCNGGNIGILLDTNSLYAPSIKNCVITGNACSQANPLQIANVWSDCLITGNMFPNGPITDNGSSNTKANNVTG